MTDLDRFRSHVDACRNDFDGPIIGVETETWVNAPDGNRWQWYVKHGDAEQLLNTVVSSGSADGCCG